MLTIILLLASLLSGSFQPPATGASPTKPPVKPASCQVQSSPDLAC